MIAALLMGRKGSKGFPGKNLFMVKGRPMSYYPMKAALDCKLIDKVYLSTDDEALMELAEKMGVEVIIRPAELCSDGALGEDVYAHGYEYIKRENPGDEVDILVLLMCNAPMVSSDTLKKGINILKDKPEVDSAVTVSRYNMWSPLRARKIDGKGLLQPFVDPRILGDPEKLNCDRDSQGDVYFADMGASIIRPVNLHNLKEGLLPQRWMGKNIYPLIQEAGLDVDYEWQMPQVEYWLSVYGPDRKEMGQK